MGNIYAGKLKHFGDPLPVSEGPVTFDPLVGFPQGRKERVVKTTPEEIRAAKVEEYLQDYCIDEYMEIQACMTKEYPFMYRCAHQRHKHAQCMYEDYILRAKEYERERRLLLRQQKLQAAAA